MTNEKEEVVIRVVRAGDEEAVLRVCRVVQKGLARQEIGIQILLLLRHPYFTILALLIFLLMYYVLQAGVGASLAWSIGLVVLVEGCRFWFFWRSLSHAFQPGPDLLNLVHYYSHPRRLFMVAVVRGEMTGTVALQETDDPDTAKLFRMFVHPEFRRRGIASRLIEACHKEAVRLGYAAVSVRSHETNPTALRCYQKAGYVQLKIENFARLYPYTFNTINLIWKK